MSPLNANHAALNAAPKPKHGEAELREAFQDLVAGTVFKTMFQSLRKMHDEPAYLNGGSAEQTFRSMMDQKVAEDVAKSHGAAISDPLFESFRARVPVGQVVAGQGPSDKGPGPDAETRTVPPAALDS